MVLVKIVILKNDLSSPWVVLVKGAHPNFCIIEPHAGMATTANLKCGAGWLARDEQIKMVSTF